MVLEDCIRLAEPVRVRSLHFDVLEEFVNASYKERYKFFCNKLLLECRYKATCFVTTSCSEQGTMFDFPKKNLSFYLFVGDTVLDPFCGSGTTILATKHYGCNSVGVETEELYCNYIVRRLESHKNIFDDYTIKYVDLSHEADAYTNM